MGVRLELILVALTAVWSLASAQNCSLTCLNGGRCQRGFLGSSDFCLCDGTGYTGDNCTVPLSDPYQSVAPVASPSNSIWADGGFGPFQDQATVIKALLTVPFDGDMGIALDGADATTLTNFINATVEAYRQVDSPNQVFNNDSIQSTYLNNVRNAYVLYGTPAQFGIVPLTDSDYISGVNILARAISVGGDALKVAALVALQLTPDQSNYGIYNSNVKASAFFTQVLQILVETKGCSSIQTLQLQAALFAANSIATDPATDDRFPTYSNISLFQLFQVNCSNVTVQSLENYAESPPSATILTPSPAPSAVALTPNSGSSSLQGGAIAGIVVGAMVAIGAVLAFFLLRRRSHTHKLQGAESLAENGKGDPFWVEGMWTGLSGKTDSSGKFNTGGLSKTATISTASSKRTYTGKFALTDPEVSIVPYSQVERRADVEAVSMDDIEVPISNSTAFESLPSKWHIPLSNVGIVYWNDMPVELGKGGFGVVYRAVVRKADAAIKIVKGGGDNEHARLLHEITILESCKSAHIVQFFGYSVSADGLLLHMEYMAGGTLYQSLRTSDEFQWYNRGRQAMRDVASGLFCLHSQDTAHLDFKSPNILITEDRHAKIADLGLGKLINGLETTATQAGTFVWCAPEQILQGKCGLASDVWSFSTVLLEVCTLEKASRALSEYNVMVPEQAPAELISLIKACRAPEPQDRPSISVICDWLDRIP